jgi:Uncharacterized protein conserved in bacteria
MRGMALPRPRRSRLCSLVWAFPVNAQTYPDRPIRVIVPIAAGSVTDVIMRATANELTPRLGQRS